MGRFFLRFFLILIAIVVSVIIFLSYFGIETEKFDHLIKKKANEVNKYVKLDFNKVKIHLNISKFDLNKYHLCVCLLYLSFCIIISYTDLGIASPCLSVGRTSLQGASRCARCLWC